MKNSCWRYVAAFALTLMVVPVYSAESEVEATPEEKGVSFLERKQNQDGSWSSDRKQLTDSTESFQAMYRLNKGETALNSSLKYFSQLEETTTDVLADKLLVLSNSTADTSALIAALEALQKTDGGWGIADSRRGAVPNTLKAIAALLTNSKSSSSRINDGISFLIKCQNTDGAWIFYDENSLSDVAHTAMALKMLKDAQMANAYTGSGLEQAITKAQKYLESKYNAGSYGDIVDTAWSYLAFSKIKQPAELQDTLNLLKNSQAGNGSWNDKIYDTAVCLQALSAIQAPPEEDLPDLEITESGISFNPTAPFTGNKVKVSTTIYNKGDADAENVIVELFNRDPRIDGVSLCPIQTIAMVPAGGSGQVTFEFEATGMVGPQQIVVFVDRENVIRETTKVNNAAAKILSVGGAPDLAITAESITFSKAAPQAFENVSITVTVKNVGNEVAENIPVRFLDGDTELMTLNLSGVNAGSSNKAILTTNFTEGSHEIKIQVDPDHFISRETNRTNNNASKTLTVSALPVSPADLAVESITIKPNAVVEGAEASVIITLSNRGGTAIEAPFDVKVSNGDTELLTFSVPSLASGQKAIQPIVTNFAAGTHTLTVWADSGNVVVEDDKNNNTKSATVTVRGVSTPVTEADLVAVSLVPDKDSVSIGDKIVLTATVKNSGMTEAKNIAIRLYDNDQIVGGDMTVPSLTEQQSAAMQIETNFTEAGIHNLKIVVDPENKVEESSKANNQAVSAVTVAETQRPDFQITALAFSKNNPLPGEEVTITATVKNGGNAAAPASKLLLTINNPFIDGALLIAEVDVPAIEAGAAAEATAKTQFNSGSFEVYAYADSEQAIEELNEDNNLINKEISTQPLADLLADKNQISLSHTDLATGKTVTVKAVVTNIGKADATAVKARFIDRRVGNVNYLIGETDVPALAAGKSVEVQTLWNSTGGAHTIILEIDYDNTLQEISKENNVAEKDVNMTVPETTLRVLKKDAESGELQVANQFNSYETVYFEVLHGYPDANVEGIIEGPDEKVYRVLSQGGLLQFSTSYYPAGTYKGTFVVYSKDTGVVLDEIDGSFDILPVKRITKITASCKPNRATVQEKNLLKLTAEIVNRSNAAIPGTLTYTLLKPNGENAVESMAHEVTIQPAQSIFRYTHPEFEYIFTEIGDYVLKTDFVSEFGALSDSVVIPVYEIPPVGINPAKLDINLPLGEQIMKQLELIRGGMGPGEKFDVVFMFDTTGSFEGTINEFKQQALAVMDAIKDQLGNDVNFGLSTFADFPFGEWGNKGYPIDYDVWEGGDYAYMLNHALTSDTQAIRDAFDNIEHGSGNDGPESQLEALYQLATGKGRDINGNGSYTDRGDIPPSPMGWRSGSTRIVFFATDIDFHRAGEQGGDSECPTYPGPTWDETVKALTDNGIMVVGLLPHEVTDVTNIVTETGSVDAEGKPLIFYSYGYSGQEIVNSVMEGLTSATAFNLTVRVVDDENGFFKNADPEKISILPGENGSFKLNFEGTVEQGPVDQIYNFELEIIAQGGRVVGRVPVSVLVPQKMPLSIVTDKPQYVVKETANIDVNLELTGNALKAYARKSDWKSGTLDRISADLREDKLILDVSSQTDPANIMLNSGFEDTSNWDMWKSTYNNGMYSYAYPTSYEPISGENRIEFYAEYYPDGGPRPGVSTFYQEVTIPKGAVTAKVNIKTKSIYGGKDFKIQLIDVNDVPLKTLFTGSEDTWEVISQEFDVSEYIGRTVRVALVYDPVDRSQNSQGTLYVDDFELNVTYPTYYPSGTAKFVIDGEQIVIWDKLYYGADLADNTAVSVRTRSADTIANLENAEYSEPYDGSEFKLTSEPNRYLEVELSMTTADVAVTPILNSLQVVYAKYSTTDNARLKVLVEDVEGNLVKEIADVPPIVQLGSHQNFQYQFDSTGYQPGDYRAVARLYLKGTLESEAKAAFKLITEEATSLLETSITADKLEYSGGDTAKLTSRVKNLSDVVDLTNLKVQVDIKDAADAVVKTHNYSIANLLHGILDSKNLSYAITNDVQPGIYTVIQTVTMDGLEPQVKTTTFTVKSSADQGKGILGSLIPQPSTVKRRIGDLAFAATARNTGNTDLAGVVFKVTVFDPATYAELKVLSSAATALPKEGPGYAETQQYGSKVELMPGTYPVTLKAEVTVNGATKVIPLDTNAFTVTNSAPVANAGPDQVLEATSLDKNTVILDGRGSTDENSTDGKRNDIVKYEWSLGSKVIATSEQPNVVLPVGVHIITLTVTDSCGATGKDTVQITIKSASKPIIKDLAPANGTITRELDSISATVEDKVSGINYSTLVMTLQDEQLTATYNTETGRISASFPIDSADGWYELSLTVSNNMSISATTPEWKVGLDRTPPVINELAPEADVYNKNATPTIAAKVTDAFAGIDPGSIKVSIGETILEATYDATTGKVMATVPDTLADGWHDAKIEVSDKVGNSNSATWRVGIDVTPPLITDMIPTANSEINQSTQEISAKVSDTGSGINAETIVLKIDNEVVTHEYAEDTGEITFNATDLSGGDHSVSVTVSDNAGNESSVTWQFNVKTGLPEADYLVFANTPMGMLSVSGENHTVNGKVHSNAHVMMNGRNFKITGMLTAVQSLTVGGAGHDIGHQKAYAGDVEMPQYDYNYYVSHATHTHNGDWTINANDTIPTGIHVVNGNVTINGPLNANITIVATGTIQVMGSGVSIDTADTQSGVALYSRDGAIYFNSSSTFIHGIIYAPKGLCSISVDGMTVNGAIIGDNVMISNRGLTVNPLNYQAGGAQ